MGQNDCLNALQENISRLRRLHGLTQEELGRRLGISFQAISKWENGVSLR